MISKIAIAVHVVLTLVILILTVRVLRNEQNEKQGIIEILLHEEARRFVQVPDVVGSIATAVKSAASSVVTAAVASGESLVAASLPSSVSVGTKYVCLASECAAIPGSALRLIQDLASFLPSPQETKTLQDLVDRCPNLETVLSAGLGLVFASTILCLVGIKFRLLRFVSLGLSIAAAAVFVVVTVFAVSLYNTSKGVAGLLGAKAIKGDIAKGCQAIVVIDFERQSLLFFNPNPGEERETICLDKRPTEAIARIHTINLRVSSARSWGNEERIAVGNPPARYADAETQEKG
ncbi:hypothetical protein CGGC5_v005818 [Colletotrichum fructicola Nara gc5]|uniref:Uncharacterized protein n=1 Tax=Colletotrichum fructicola (strain Nara gc5) TaxID=1213859 RepID=A0A7J6JD89_COLFN|nr:hypothetical protein CGGC5_v005818 [Colletotrichum fructicola Nara gc5]